MDDLSEQLAGAAITRFGSGATVGPLAPLGGGASRELLGFEVRAGDATHACVLRRDPEGDPDLEGTEREWAALTAAFEAGVRVPEPLWRHPPDARGEGGGFVMARVDGETIARRLLRDERYARARERLVADVAAGAARIHGVPLDDLGLGEPDGAPALAATAALEQRLDELGEPHPVLELGLRWLRRNAPPPRPLVLVHGDLRLGNLIVGEDGLRAILDWELVHAGDAVEDLGWLCTRAWRFGADDRPALGCGSRDELLAAYAAAGGPEVTRDELRYWELHAHVRWGVICVQQAAVHLSGARRSFEHAMIGRRTCEPEWDVLAMLGAAAREPDAPAGLGEAREADSLQDRPTAAELLDALGGFLREDLLPGLARELRFGVLVAANAAAILAREARAGDPTAALAPLAALTGSSTLAAGADPAAIQAELARAIRAGELDDRQDETVEALRTFVAAKLAVAHPGYDTFADDGRG